MAWKNKEQQWSGAEWRQWRSRQSWEPPRGSRGGRRQEKLDKKEERIEAEMAALRAEMSPPKSRNLEQELAKESTQVGTNTPLPGSVRAAGEIAEKKRTAMKP